MFFYTNCLVKIYIFKKSLLNFFLPSGVFTFRFTICYFLHLKSLVRFCNGIHQHPHTSEGRGRLSSASAFTMPCLPFHCQVICLPLFSLPCFPSLWLSNPLRQISNEVLYTRFPGNQIPFKFMLFPGTHSIYYLTYTYFCNIFHKIIFQYYSWSMW